MRKLLAQRHALKKAALELVTAAEASGEWSEETQKAFEAKEAEIAAIDAKIAIAQKKEALKLEIEAEEVTEEEPKAEVTKPNVVATGTERFKFNTLGENLIHAYKAGRGNADSRMRMEKLAAASGLNEAVNSDGGYLVQEDFISGLMSNAFETGKLTSRCRRIQISSAANKVSYNAIDESSRVNGSRGGGILGYWEGEAEDMTTTKPKFKKHTLELKKLTGLCYVTDELLEDASALESIVNQGFSDEFGFKMDDAVMRGSGAGQPFGFLNSPALVTIAKESGQSDDTVVAANIYKMYARMHPNSVPSSVWVINQQVWVQLLQLNQSVGTGGLPIFLPPSGISAAPYGTLLGRPIIVAEHASALGDLGDINFIDLSQYALAEKGGIERASSIHVRFEYNETAFRFILRADGQPMWSSAITPYKGTETTSPFITLAARA